MNSTTVRQKFLDFFHARGHEILSSSPMVIKNDPTLMFTNAGMNQFKEIFLGNAPVKYTRIANTQKCLRVSGKHNDLEEVGHDGYHHTMFEMLGNWSFGNYFKKEAIQWAWEFLTREVEIDMDRIYVSIFEGDESEGLEKDLQSYDYWKSWIREDRIVTGSKKDNFWEMGESGPCGPCSEIHVDLRDDNEREKISGRELVNKGNPLVIEIWNLVFIQYNRKVTGELVLLPRQHVDTGMGFERLCMVLQHKTSNYDTDIFQPVIREISTLSGIPYGESVKPDIAMRVIADHLRAIAFAIADGQLPSNVKAGYVIRRILRRAVRYNYTFLNQNKPMIFKLMPSLIHSMGKAFPEINTQRKLIEKVIFEEEQSFLRTLESGDKRLKESIAAMDKGHQSALDGKIAFELYDTFGFPLDLTELILKENGYTLNRAEFDHEMAAQKNRSKSAASVEAEDWVILDPETGNEGFIGYDRLKSSVKINRYRKVVTQGRKVYHLVFDRTPFYAESGGQAGDVGVLMFNGDKINITNTIKEHGLIIHVADALPPDPTKDLEAAVSRESRSDTAKNHTATHLLHHALREILGTHVEQKGSLVNADYLRFDFAHFQKMTEAEIAEVEKRVNQNISEGIEKKEMRGLSMDEAKKMGAMALFGEKYGDSVRVIQFGNSVELCGGTHVDSTSRIGLFKIISEGSIATGIRRIEAITGEKALNWYSEKVKDLKQIEDLLNHPQDVLKAITHLVEEKNTLQKKLDRFALENAEAFKNALIKNSQPAGNFRLVISRADEMIENAAILREISFQLHREKDDLILVSGAVFSGKPHLVVMLPDKLVSDKHLNAGEIVKVSALEFDGGGGGQPFFATAGGKNPDKLDAAMEKAARIIRDALL